MLTRIYRYKIRSGSEENYLRLQEEVLALYRTHAEVDALFLRDMHDPTLRTEIIRFAGPDPDADIRRIDADQQILELFASFQAEILDPLGGAICREALMTEDLSAAGKPHHTIPCSLAATRESLMPSTHVSC